MLNLLCQLLLAYLLGSLLGSQVIGFCTGRSAAKLRQTGSGNLGATNALRTHGPLFALGVLLFDLGKGLLAVLLLPGLQWFAANKASLPAESLITVSLPYLLAAAVVAGHVYSLFSRFKGGKGVATLAGVLLALAPSLFPALLLLWLAVLIASGYVSLATLIMAGLLPFGLTLVAAPGAGITAAAFALLMALFVAYTHRDNIRRLRAGKENRFERIRISHLLRRLFGSAAQRNDQVSSHASSAQANTKRDQQT